MQLSSTLLREFASITDDRPDKPKETTLYGTVVQNENDDQLYVQLDGSDILTPVEMAMDARVGDRVVVMIKNHQAIITGNTSNPASAYTASTYIKTIDNTLLLVGGDNVGVRSQSESGGSIYRAEVVVDSRTANDPKAQIQIYKVGDPTKQTIVHADLDGLTVNGYDVLRTNNYLVSGQLIIKGNINANSFRKFSGTINNIPQGFALVGVSAVQAYADPFDISSPPNFPVINFYAKTGIKGEEANAFECWVQNRTNAKTKVGVYVYWFAMRAAVIDTEDTEVIDLPD